MKGIIVEGKDPKLPFQQLSNQAYGNDATLFLELLHFTPDPYLMILNVLEWGNKYYFWVFGMAWPGI